MEHCCGYADRATGPGHPATRFGLASLTKMFTAVAVVHLVGHGRLGFDTPVVDLLPPERRPTTLLPEVTVHHLLCHTSGIADYCEEDEDSPGVPRGLRLAVARDAGATAWSAGSTSCRSSSTCRRTGRRASYQYSNAAYVVLGLVVEELPARPSSTPCRSASSTARDG